LSPLRALSSSAAACIVLALAAQGHAFCLTRTCEPPDQCKIVDGCNMSGHVLFWASSTVSFDVQKDSSCVKNLDRTCQLLADGTPKIAITSDTLEQVVTTAFGTWMAADCGKDTQGNDTHPNIRLKDLGQIECAKPEYNKTGPNANVITFHDSTWPYSTSSGADTLALTTVFFDGDTGEIYDANVEINSNLQTFALSDAQYPTVDLNSVLTHELGHFLGLSHSSFTSATMFSNYDEGMKTLESDDVAAICQSLPPGRDTVDTDLPRHGFSTDCGVAEKGCCSSTIGGPSPSGQRLGLWAFGLGLCAFVARGRRARLTRSVRALRR
jgi:hypothetical protein